MNNAIISFPTPANEPVKAYLAGSPERAKLDAELERQSKIVVDIPIIIGGKEIRTGDVGQVTCPHDHKHVLATYHKVGKKEKRKTGKRENMYFRTNLNHFEDILEMVVLSFSGFLNTINASC